jgi:hypothetical protein
MCLPSSSAVADDVPPAGEAFNTVSTLPTRRVVSWFFGDGAAVFNQANAALALPGRIAPIDSALMSRGTRRDSAADFGVRVSRHLTDRLAGEFSLDLHDGSLGLCTSHTRRDQRRCRQLSVCMGGIPE